MADYAGSDYGVGHVGHGAAEGGFGPIEMLEGMVGGGVAEVEGGGGDFVAGEERLMV